MKEALKKVTPFDLATLAVSLIPRLTEQTGNTTDAAIDLAIQYLEAAELGIEARTLAASGK
jgi:hypothetical protein